MQNIHFLLSYFGMADAILNSNGGHTKNFFELIEGYVSKQKFIIKKLNFHAMLKIMNNPVDAYSTSLERSRTF